MIDTHSHIQFPAYDEDRKDVIARAETAGVATIVIGTQISTSKEGIKIAIEYPRVVLGATAGFHPNHLAPDEFFDAQELRAGIKEEFDGNALRELAEDKHILGVGECGLDYYRLPKDPEVAAKIEERQKEVFVSHIKIASEFKKPLVIHCRSAFQDLISLLVANNQWLGTTPGVIHFFSGTADDARQLIDLGFYIAFGGVITFAKDYEEIVRFVPLERIVLETDAPYVTPAPYRGKRNESAYVIETAKKLAEIKNISLEEVAIKTTENAKKLFGLN